MKEEIKHLRIKIDGLAQLTKDLGEWKYYLDLKDIPEGVTIEDYAKSKGKILSNCGYKHKTQQVADATKSLYFAKAWLGKMLGELGSENPYKSGYKTVEDIERTADVDEGYNSLVGYNHLMFKYEWEQKNHIEKVDWLRTEINKISSELTRQKGRIQFLTLSLEDYKEEDNDSKDRNYNMWNCINNTYNYLCEARFNLGFELERLKEFAE